LELGDEAAVEWLRQTFPEGEIRRVLSTERRLSEKSANFWALVYGVPSREASGVKVSRFVSQNSACKLLVIIQLLLYTDDRTSQPIVGNNPNQLGIGSLRG